MFCCLSTCQAACQRLRQESPLQTQQGSVRAIPQLCWNENVCASHSDFSKPANSTAQRLVTWKEWAMTEVLLFYIPMKKVFRRIFLASLTQLKSQTNLLPQVIFRYGNLHCIVRFVSCLSQTSFSSIVFSIEEALKATQLTLTWLRLQDLVL